MSVRQREMSWEAIGALAELLGAGGVIASLIYVALQVRQNTAHLDHSIRAMQDAALRDSRTMTADLSTLVMAEGEFARIYRLGLGSSPKLGPDERIRFDMYMLQFFVNIETLFLLHRRGSLEVELWSATKARATMLLATPGGRDSWERLCAMMSQAFRDFVHSELLTPPAA